MYQVSSTYPVCCIASHIFQNQEITQCLTWYLSFISQLVPDVFQHLVYLSWRDISLSHYYGLAMIWRADSQC